MTTVAEFLEQERRKRYDNACAVFEQSSEKLVSLEVKASHLMCLISVLQQRIQEIDADAGELDCKEITTLVICLNAIKVIENQLIILSPGYVEFFRDPNRPLNRLWKTVTELMGDES